MVGSDRIFIGAMRVVPKKRLSRFVRKLASVRSRVAVERFARRYGASVDEAERPLAEYTSILDFFTRRLKPGLRPLDPNQKALLSPVDGAFLAGGPIGAGRLFQAKGRSFTIGALLADPQADARFAAGSYITVYLAPRDYHRIHAPASGVISGYTYVPGSLFPVNAAAVAHVDELFARNERLITHLETEAFGRIEVVKVGATCVGHIKVNYDPDVSTNVGAREVKKKMYVPPIAIERGAELGVFEMGSTVILVTEKPVDFAVFGDGQGIKLGTALGVLG